jgi:hypothetical protein
VGVRSEIGALQTWQFTVRAGRVDADYHPTRSNDAVLHGRPDPKSPAGRIDIWEMGATVSVWLTRIARISANFQTYHAPPNGSAVALPSQLAGSAEPPWLHEFTLRARMTL